MELGIFTRTYARSSLAETLDEVARYGFSWVQHKFANPEVLFWEETQRAHAVREVRQAMVQRGIGTAALSGTYNIIHADPRVVADGEAYVRALSEVAPFLETKIITLCTGTRDPGNMWAFHPDNRTAEAWRAMLAAMERLLLLTEGSGCIFGVEPEYNNVVHSAASARQLLDTLQTDRVKIIMDAANLLLHCPRDTMDTVLEEAFDVLGEDIVLAHGKDLKEEESHDDVVPGTGYVNFTHYLDLLNRSPYTGPLVLHGFSESQTPAALEYIGETMAALGLRDR